MESLSRLPGAFDFLILIIIIFSLQAWWIIPIIKKNNKFNDRGQKLRNQINKLEKLYKNK
tara:strand:- start:541 stop:720 length:180 start_codon:yes stop_codon:yes gene_type:complete